LNKVAIISDIQGNLTALKYVLKEIDSESVDQIICLGDVASGAYPHEVVTLLRQRDIKTIKGNMDDAILNPRRHDTTDPDIERYDDIDQWCSEQLTDADKAFMRNFAPLLRVQLDMQHQLVCFHGSPYSYNDVIDETTPDDILRQYFEGYHEDVMLTGHIHHPLMRIYKEMAIVCPGSVGLPRRRDGKHPFLADYVLIDGREQHITIQFRQVDIPKDEFKKDILNSGMPHSNWFLSLWDV